MKKQKGFTLIELLIIIVVLGLIIALFFTVFNNPFQNASVNSSATKIVDDMRSIDEGWNKYFIDTTTEATNITTLTTGANPPLRTAPVPPENAKDSAFTGTYAYAIDTANYDVNGNGTADVVVVLKGVTQTVCSKINEKYTDLGATVPTALQTGKSIQCYDNAGTKEVVKLIYAK